MKPIEHFSRDAHTFWATTYQLDLKLFDQFLLRRLGSTPLNAVVLCDEDGVSDALLNLSDVDAHVAANANRRYLLRGMRLASGGRFHPKTYLFASRRRTVLLVGSGNLTRTGLDRGRETFVEFDASHEEDLPTFRAWGTWIRELANEHGDATLRRRYEHLISSVPVLVGPPADSPFFTNHTLPLIDVIAQRAPANVAELHACAPYFDPQAIALRQLIERLKPDSIHLYFGARTNVDGTALRRVLEGSGCNVHLNAFDPSTFTHAKLIGLVAPDDSGLLVCGSANLSQAALTLVYAASATSGNCEAVVVREGPAASVRAAFIPPRVSLIEQQLGDLDQLEYDPDDPGIPGWPIRLLSAHRTADGHLQAKANALLDGLAIQWSDEREPVALQLSGLTVDPITDDDDVLIVWLCDGQGDQLSNPVVIDDPEALEAVLGDADSQRDRPAELCDEEGTSELLRLLTWAHRRFIFDLDETPAFQRATAAQDQQDKADDTGFWERYAREELVSDPRSQTYRPVTASNPLIDTDALLREIEAMLYAAPGDRRLRILTATEATTQPEKEPQPGTPWTLSARERVRSRNLLRRWARALADPRHVWLSPTAPARNYEALLEVLALIWLSEALEASDIVQLLQELWTSFLGSNSRAGLVDCTDRNLAAELIASLSDDSRQIGAALAYCALYGELGWTTWIYDWQPFLTRGLDADILAAGPLAADVVEALIAARPSEQELTDAIRERATWTDDATWGDRLAAELGLARVRLEKNAQFRNVTTVVRIDGLRAPASDSRLIVVARRAMSFRGSDHVLLMVGDQRFLIRLGDHCRALVDSRSRTSIAAIDAHRLAAVERQGGTLTDLLGHPAAA